MAQINEAVATARVVGSDQAAAQLGMDPRTVRGWLAKAGYRPELDAPSDSLQALYDLAVARTTSEVVAGRIKGSALMTVVGIARDKLDRAARWTAARAQAEAESEPDDGIGPLTHAATDRLMAHVDSLVGPDREIAQRAVREAVNAAREYQRTAVPPSVQGSPAEQDAVFAQSLDTFTASLAEPGSLEAYAARFAEADRIQEARNEQRRRAQTWLDDATADLLIQAESLLDGPDAA